MISGHVEHRPENGAFPYGVVIERGEMKLWIARLNEAHAQRTLPDIIEAWRLAGGK